MFVRELILEKRPVNGANLMGSLLTQLSIDIDIEARIYDRNYRGRQGVVVLYCTMDKTERDIKLRFKRSSFGGYIDSKYNEESRIYIVTKEETKVGCHS